MCSQVTALLVELAEMRRVDPGAKAVVFSAWGRLLKLVGGALAANGLEHVSLAGAQPEARAAALHPLPHRPRLRRHPHRPLHRRCAALWVLPRLPGDHLIT